MAPQLVSVIGCLYIDNIMMIDRIPAQGESLGAKQYHEALGGKGGNSAIATYRASHARPPDGAVTAEPEVDEIDDIGIEVCLISAVGDDAAGRELTDELQRNGVDVSGVRKVPDKKSGVSFVLVEAKTGENRLVFANNANDALTIDDFTSVEGLANGRRPDLIIAQMEIGRAVVEQMIVTAGEEGIEFLLNAAPANVLLSRLYPYLTHLIVNELEAMIMSGVEEVSEETWEEITDYFLGLGVKNVVLTLGTKGAYFAGSDDSGHVPAYKVKVLDCTGAGDTFIAAYAVEYLRQKQTGQWDIRAAVVHACGAAALTITKIGAQEGIPWMDEIASFKEGATLRQEASEAATDEER